MSTNIQDIIVFILFIYAVWSLIQQLRGSLRSGGCSDSCGSCTSIKKDIAKMKVKKLEL